MTLLLALLAACAMAQPLNTVITIGTYLGNGADQLIPVSVDVVGTQVLVAANGKFSFNLQPIVPLSSVPSDNGTLAYITYSSKTVQRVVKIGNHVDSAKGNAKGQVVVSGDFGVAVLDANAKLEWHAAWPVLGLQLGASALSKAVISDDGHVAVRINCTWATFDPTGKVLNKVTANEQDCTDVEIYHTAMLRTYFHNSNTGKEPIVMPGLVADDLATGRQLWRDYDYDPHQLRPPADKPVKCGGQVADARAFAARVGEDDLLYYAGRSDGGDSLYNCDPRDVNKSVPIVGTDKFNQPYNMAAQGITFIARMDPTTGEVQQGQFQLARLPNNRGNSLSTISIAADKNGVVYLAQNSACCIANRDNLTINGEAVAPYAGGDGLFMALSKDFRTRLSWTAFSAVQGGSSTSAVDVAARNGVVAWVGTANGAMITVQPLAGTAPAPASTHAGYLALLPAF